MISRVVLVTLVLAVIGSNAHNCHTPDIEPFCFTGHRWRYEPSLDRCLLKSVCQGPNSPNMYSSELECIHSCSNGGQIPNGICAAPALHPAALCVAVLQQRWFYNPLKQQCEFGQVCPLNGPNRYSSRQECENTCFCNAPATHPAMRCFAPAFAYRFDGAQCVNASVCPEVGPNKFATLQDCQMNCDPQLPDPTIPDGICESPALSPMALCQGPLQKKWTYNVIDQKCEFTEVCPPNGKNRYSSRQECENTCFCNAPATHPLIRCFAPAFAYRFDGAQCVNASVCPEFGPNKFASIQACQNSCDPQPNPTTPPTTPSFCLLKPDPAYYYKKGYSKRQMRKKYGCNRCQRWFYNSEDGECHRFTYYGCFNRGNKNNFESLEECELTCVPTCPADKK